MTLKRMLQEAYLEWVNDFITLERFAEYYGLTYAQADALLKVAKSVHEDIIKEYDNE